MAACTRDPGDDLDTMAIHPFQRKETKMQRTMIRLMVAVTWHVGFGPRAETNTYLKRARQMGKSLITASTQRTDSSPMAMAQRTTMSWVVVE